MRQLEQAVEDLQLSRRVPGFQYVVVDATSTLRESCGGYAQLHGRPMTLDTTLNAYSMSKTITAAAVLQLIEGGSIGFADAVSHYVRWQPYGEDVTVRGLLAHTAGLPNPNPLRWAHPADDHLMFNERAAFRGVLAKHGRRATHPGKRYIYSNIGYWLLGALVEEVTSESFTSYVTDNVFTPLNLRASEMAYVIADERRHACGYLERCSFLNFFKPLLMDPRLFDGPVGRWVAVRAHYPNGPAFGGLVGTANAFGKFLRDQLGERSKLFGPAAQAWMVEQQRTDRGTIPMTLGWHMGSLGPWRYFFKQGGGVGFRGAMRLYRSRGIGTVFMANATTVNVSRILDRLDIGLLPAASS